MTSGECVGGADAETPAAVGHRHRHSEFGWLLVIIAGELAVALGACLLFAIIFVHGMSVWAAQGSGEPPFPWSWVLVAAAAALALAAIGSVGFALIGGRSRLRAIALGLVVVGCAVVLAWVVFPMLVVVNRVL